MDLSIYIKQQSELWSLIVQELKPLLSPDKLIIDVGMGLGMSLITLRKKLPLVPLMGVNPYPHLNFIQMGYDGDFYQSLNIDVLPVLGTDDSIPYDQAQLVIKTYNNFIKWSEIVGRTKSGTFFLVNMNEDHIDILSEGENYNLVKIINYNKISFGVFSKK